MSHNIIGNPHFELCQRAKRAYLAFPRKERRKLLAGMRKHSGSTIFAILSSFGRRPRREILSGSPIVHQVYDFIVLLKFNGVVIRILDIIQHEGHVLAEFFRCILGLEEYFASKYAKDFEREVVLLESAKAIELAVATRLRNRCAHVLVRKFNKPLAAADDRWWVGLNQPPWAPTG